MSAAECVRNYKRLCNVERAFHTIKAISLRVRPIHHRTADRVRAHIFLCMLAYYVEWHMREAWRELLFADPHLDELTETRDPVLPAIRSSEARKKVATARLENGSAGYCFRTLIEHLETITVNTCRAKSANGDGLQFELTSVAMPSSNKLWICSRPSIKFDRIPNVGRSAKFYSSKNRCIIGVCQPICLQTSV